MSPSAPHAAGSVHTVSQVLYMYTAQVQRGYPHCTGTLSGVNWSGQTMRRGSKILITIPTDLFLISLTSFKKYLQIPQIIISKIF